MQAGQGDVTHPFFPNGRCFIAIGFAEWSVPEAGIGWGGGAGRDAGRVQAEARQPERAAQAGRRATASEPRSLKGQPQASISRGAMAGSCLK